jgi:hypothetical protein
MAVAVTRKPLNNAVEYALYGSRAPSIVMDFARGEYLDSRITFTRATSGWRFNSAGTLEAVTSGNPRFDYDPSTLAPRGLLIEDARTNSIRNNTMQGVAAGTPGTAPTNWILADPSNGLALQIVGSGVESGITYIDIRYSGTTDAASSTAIGTEALNQVVASSGQSWTFSSYIRLVGGTLANITSVLATVAERQADGTFITATNADITSITTSAGLATQRGVCSRTLNNGATARVSGGITFTYSSGVAIDVTLRIGLPQLELGAMAGSVIETSTTAVTRNADLAVVSSLVPWFNPYEGTLVAEWIPAQQTAGGAVVGLNDGTTNNRMNLNQTAGVAAQFFTVNGGVSQANLNTGTTVIGSVARAAGAYKENNFALSVNGATPSLDTAGTVPTPTRMSIGVQTGAGTYLFGWVRRIAYYTRRLSDYNLKALST